MTESSLVSSSQIANNPVNILEVPSDVYYRVFSNSKYKTILQILTRPLTIDEIEERYHHIAQQKEKKSTKKKSLYRSMQSLIETGFVIKIGRKVDGGKILYGKKGQIIIIENPAQVIFEPSRAKHLVEVIGMITHPYWTKTETQIAELSSVLRKYHESAVISRNQLLNQILDTNDLVAQETSQIINDLSVESSYSFFEFLDELVWILRSPVLDEYQQQIQQILTELPLTERTKKPSVEKSTEKNDTFQDFITFQPVPVKIMPKNTWKATLSDIRLRAIIRILREKPMTIKEIHQNHLRVMKEIRAHDKENGKYDPKNESLIAEKTENSIYRYLQTLKKDGYIIEAGRRIITENAQVTQMLYSRTARAFFHFSSNEEFWHDEENKTVLIQALSIVLQHVGSGFSPENFEDLLLEYAHVRNQQLTEKFEQITDSQITDQIFLMTDGELHTVIRSIAHLGYVLSQKGSATFQTRLKECFQ